VPDDAVASKAGYEPEFFEHLVRAEDRHFWFRHRNRVITDAVEPLVRDLPAGYRVLEVGCGTGNTLRILERTCHAGVVVGSDPFEEGLRIARRRVACELVQSTVEELRVSGAFDLICAFDVLEHVSDDVRALTELRHRLQGTGAVLLTVPAHQKLWSPVDEAGHHYRRYSEEQLQMVLERAGYRVTYMTPFMSVLYPLIWMARRATRSPSGRVSRGRAFELARRELRIIPLWNEVLLTLLSLELPRLRARARIPVGTSILAVARRQDDDSVVAAG
jgi:SAM-dependent methyltransferase